MRSLQAASADCQTGQGNGKAPSRILALDTSTALLSTAILVDGEVVAERHSAAERNHSIRLVPAIEELLAEAGMTAADLDGIAVGSGPGSYTGVRIAVTVAKTLAWSLQLPLVSVSTLAALALGGKQNYARGQGAPVWVAPILDARRENVYTGLYALWDGAANMQNMSGDRNRQLQQWLDELIGAAIAGELDGTVVERPAEILVVGETGRFTAQLQAAEERARQGGISFGWQESQIDAAYIGAIGLVREWDAEEVHDVVPNYTQLAEAEAKLLAKRT
ncbi:tRNA (adenosine(37)-N6)-threonylcarbamoyltransferase complex dimerization subunit type 1 TsaB [Xylanibacillus composti]|nr:tRNA (adenosine(37)-N6)-threonylcarbamoyltransferase complex dimerization subunit type 1 TsaB [Xylanibacillus composti]MDT9723843.1 tRNA (adenosine(37)-N6)-threonylcarbamoyltransferase complex dimerization subunit type 1 TsaB [Xylanibacillus composti]